MTTDSSACSFYDALYVNANEEDSGKSIVESQDVTSSYYSVPTLCDETVDSPSFKSIDSRAYPPEYMLESHIDLELLEETLNDIDEHAVPEKIVRTGVGNDGESLSDSFLILNSRQHIPLLTKNNQHHSSNDRSSDIPRKVSKSSLTSKTSEKTNSYIFDGEYIENDSFEQPYMEYDESWQPCAQSSPTKKEAREKIFIRELSFDELQDLKGVDLMAPVFMAVTNEDDDNVLDMKRKSKSIEDLCSVIAYPDSEGGIFKRQRSKSALLTKTTKRKRSTKPSTLTTDCADDDTNSNKNIDISLEDAKERLCSLSTSLCSHQSCEDIHEPNACEDFLPSTPPPDQLIEVFEENNDDVKELKLDLSAIDKRNPHRVDGKTCGFWEYPYGSPSSPKGNESPVLIRSQSFNTSPKSEGAGIPSDRFVVVNVAGDQRIVDMKLIESYLNILSHGGHHNVGDACHVIVVFNAYYLPKRSLPKYDIIMEQLFYYCVHALDLLVTDAYEIVYFNSAMDTNNIPRRQLIKQFYDVIQYRLKKNLKYVYFVHPSFLLKTIIRFTGFYTSTKFRRKMHFVKNLKTLKAYLPLEYIFIGPELRLMEKKFT